MGSVSDLLGLLGTAEQEDLVGCLGSCSAAPPAHRLISRLLMLTLTFLVEF